VFTRLTFTAGNERIRGHSIAGHKGASGTPNLHHSTGEFVTQGERRGGPGVSSSNNRNIGTTKAARFHLDQRFFIADYG
jgi:hypothetical protein